MSITGSLTDFPFPAILQFIEKGKKTGLLTVSTNSVSLEKQLPVHYIWVHDGLLVAAANQLDDRGLVQLINQRQGVSDRVVSKLAQLCPPDKPLGLHLVNQKVLQPSQLKQLFCAQVLQTVYALFQLKEGQFQFDQNASLPVREMTGLSVAAGIPTFLASLQNTETLEPNRLKSEVAATTPIRCSPDSDNIEKFSRIKGLLKKELAPVFA
jgi:hypothetical protein